MAKKPKPQNREIKEFVETVPKHFIEKLRRIVAPPGKKGTWLRHLSDAQLSEIYFRLRAGQPCYALARMAQDQWGLMVQSQPQSLSRSVRSFRDKALNDIKLAKIVGDTGNPSKNRQLQILDKKTKNLTEKLHLEQVSAWSILQQQERAILAMHFEKQAGFLSKETNDILKNLGDLITAHVKNFGVRPPDEDKPGLRELHIHTQINQALGNMQTVEREKMADIALRFADKLQENAIALVKDEDGSFAYTKKKKGKTENDDVNECVPVNGSKHN